MKRVKKWLSLEESCERRFRARPLFLKWLGIREKKNNIIDAKLSRQLSSSLGQEEFVRVKVGKVGHKYVATPLSRGAGIMMSLVRGDGILRIPPLSEGLAADSRGQVGLSIVYT